MTVTLHMPPELESRLRDAAAREGMDADTFVRRALEERLGRPTSRESDLLAQTHLSIPAETWMRYRQLREKRDDRALSPEEHAELLQITNRVEEANVRRMAALIELARIRGVSVDDLMRSLGIRPGSEDPTEAAHG